MFICKSIFLLLFNYFQASTIQYEFFTQNMIDSEGWVIESQLTSNSKSSDCGGHALLGGLSIFGQKTQVTNLLPLQPHSQIIISFDFWKYYDKNSRIDNWGVNDKIIIYADETLIVFPSSSSTGFTGGSDFCGANINDQVLTVAQKINHNFQNVLVVFYSELTSIDGFWGIANFKLEIVECPQGCSFCEIVFDKVQCMEWILVFKSLTQTTQAEFQTEGWQVTNNKKGPSLCQNIPLLCGRDYCGRFDSIELYHRLPIHKKLKVQIRYFLIDTWDTENAYLNIDAVQSMIITYKLYTIGQIRCYPKDYNNWSKNEEITIYHTNQDLKINFFSDLDDPADNESFGIRDVQIFIDNRCEISYYNECCGDQIKQMGEDCDDGNMIPFDGCHNCLYSCIEGCINCIKGICFECQTEQENQIMFKTEDCSICQNGQYFDKLTFTCVSLLIPTLPKPINYTYSISEPLCIIFQYDQCIKCQDNYQLNQFTNKCESICGDGIINGNEQCDDGIYDNCYQCQIVKYNQCNEKCSYCYYGECLKCNYGYSLQNNDCITICGDNLVNKDKNNNGKQIEECDNIDSDGCFNCMIQSRFMCISEDNSICWTCDDLCIECIKINDQLQCLECKKGYFPKGINCFQCQNNCVTCYFESDMCTSCYREDCQLCENIDGLYTDSQNDKCKSICGDGFLIKDIEQCDDGNIYNNDGCDSQCNIEFQFNNYNLNIQMQKKVELDKEQQGYFVQIDNAFEAFSYLMLILAGLSVIFQVFEYFWSILEILSWVNNFYYINVQYPYNVEYLFKKCDWSQYSNIPTYQYFNQPGQEYYFQGPERFQNKGVDPLFINNIQVSFAVVGLSIILYLISLLLLGIVILIDKHLQREINCKNSQPFSIFKLKTLKQQTLYRTQQTKQQENIQQNSEPIIKIVRNSKIVKLLTILIKITQSLKRMIKSTVSLLLLDITMAVVLQLLFSTQFQYFIILINELLALLTCILIYHQLNQFYKLIGIHSQLAENYQFKLIYGNYYEGLNIHNTFGFQYNFLYFSRKVLYIFLLVFFYYKSIFQTCLCFMTFATGVLLLLKQNPYETRRQFIHQFIQEFSFSVIIGISILFAFNDQIEKINEDNKIILGWIVISFILLSLLSEITTLIYEILRSFLREANHSNVDDKIRSEQIKQELNQKPLECQIQKGQKLIPSNVRLQWAANRAK